MVSIVKPTVVTFPLRLQIKLTLQDNCVYWENSSANNVPKQIHIIHVFSVCLWLFILLPYTVCCCSGACFLYDLERLICCSWYVLVGWEMLVCRNLNVGKPLSYFFHDNYPCMSESNHTENVTAFLFPPTDLFHCWAKNVFSSSNHDI